MMETYDRRSVLFLDILGFSDLVCSGKGNLLLKTLQDLQSQARAVEQVGKMNFTVFSDCVVVSAPMSDPKGCVNVVEYSRILALDLFSKGFLTRGALVAGELYHEDGIVLGKALVDAYRLESKKAIYPRIVVDHRILQVATEELSRSRPGVPNIGEKYFREDFDGSYHLDIFHHWYFVPQIYWGPKMDIGLKQFRDSCLMFVDRLFASPIPPVAQEKYAWLANYFFEKCQQYRWPLPDNLPVSNAKRARHDLELRDENATDPQDD